MERRVIAGLITSACAVATSVVVVGAPAAASTTGFRILTPHANDTVGGAYVNIQVTEDWDDGSGGTDDCDGYPYNTVIMFRLDGAEIDDAFISYDDVDEAWTWDARSVSTGGHTLSASCDVAYPGTGTVTSSVLLNVDSSGDTVQLTAPTADASVSGTLVNLAATAAGDAAIGSQVQDVTFAIDGDNVGDDTLPPYQLGWDSTTVDNGIHQLSATAVDDDGFSATAIEDVDVENLPTETTLAAPSYAMYASGIGLRVTIRDADTGAGLQGLP